MYIYGANIPWDTMPEEDSAAAGDNFAQADGRAAATVQNMYKYEMDIPWESVTE